MSFSVTSPSGTDSSCAPAGQAGSRSIADEIPELCTAYTPFRTRNRRKSPPALYCSQVAPSASNGHLRSDPAIRRMSKSLSTHGFAERGRVSLRSMQIACFARRGLRLPADDTVQMGGRRAGYRSRSATFLALRRRRRALFPC